MELFTKTLIVGVIVDTQKCNAVAMTNAVERYLGISQMEKKENNHVSYNKIFSEEDKRIIAEHLNKYGWNLLFVEFSEEFSSKNEYHETVIIKQQD